MRGEGPFLFAKAKEGFRVPEIAAYIEKAMNAIKLETDCTTPELGLRTEVRD